MSFFTAEDFDFVFGSPDVPGDCGTNVIHRAAAKQANAKRDTEIERLRSEADEWQVQCGRSAKAASDLRIELERLRAENAALHRIIVDDKDTNAQNERFEADNARLREALGRAISFIDQEPVCNITRRHRCNQILEVLRAAFRLWSSTHPRSGVAKPEA